MMASTIGTTSVAPERRSPIRNAARLDAAITAGAPNAIGAAGRARRMPGWLEDAGLLLLLTLAFPLVVLIMGAPVALLVRLLIEIGRQW